MPNTEQLNPSMNLLVGSSLAQSESVMIWIADTSKSCIYFNKAWLKARGRSLAQELEFGWLGGIHPHDYQRYLDCYHAAFDQRLAFKMDYRLMLSDNRYHWVTELGSPYFDSEGLFQGYMGICFNVSESKAVQLKLQNAVKALDHLNQANSVFLHNLCQELSMSLNTITFLTQASLKLDKIDPLSKECRQHLQDIQASSVYLSEVVRRAADENQAQLKSINSNLDLFDPLLEQEEVGQAQLNGLTALIAEDDSMSRSVFAALLGSSGLNIVFATNGEEALAQAKVLSQKNTLDFILLDLHMPKLDGLTLAKSLRKFPDFKTIPMIAVSADVFEVTKHSAFEAGFDGFITKPVDMNGLFQLLQKLFSKRAR